MDNIDEGTLGWKDRLGLCYVRLLCWQWDDLLGPKPEGFDLLPNFSPKGKRFGNKIRCKDTYIRPTIDAIETVLDYADLCRYWWKFHLGRSEEEWLRWFISETVRLT